MITLPRPRFNAADTYAACLSGMRAIERKTRLVSDSDFVAEAGTRYSEAGEDNAVSRLNAADFHMPTATTDDMTWLYDNRFAGRARGTRRIYDSIKQSAPYGRCALCGVRDATTLDHCLPKSVFPALAVNPLNLVPSCGRCNQLKSSQLDSVIHSYFDELLLGELLRASIAEEKPCTVLFKIVCPESWPENLSVRARKHFLVLRLGELYALEAARTLRGEALALRHVFEASGSDGVHAYVKEQAESWTASDGNCWEAAMYTAMSKSSWFCDGGFEIG